MCVEGRPTQPEQAPGTGPSPHSPVQLPLPRLPAINTEKQLTKTTKKREGPKGAGGEGGGGEGGSPAEPLLTRRALCYTERRPGRQRCDPRRRGSRRPLGKAGMGGGRGRSIVHPRPHLGAMHGCRAPPAGRRAAAAAWGAGAAVLSREPSLAARAPLSAGGSAQESWKVETTNSCT